MPAPRHKLSAFVIEVTVFLEVAGQLPRALQIVERFGRLWAAYGYNRAKVSYFIFTWIYERLNFSASLCFRMVI